MNLEKERGKDIEIGEAHPKRDIKNSFLCAREAD
jgi:hypothetical protein